MRPDPAQLTVPQIAAAVADGSLQLAEAEAELRRRPGDRPCRFNQPSAPARPSAPSQADILRALADTQRELRQTNRRLSQLSDRIEALTELAARLDASAAATPTRPSYPARPRDPSASAEPSLFPDLDERDEAQRSHAA